MTSIFRDIKSFLWLNRASSTTKYEQVTGHLQFLNVPFGSQLRFFLNVNFSTKKNTASHALCCIAGSSQQALLLLVAPASPIKTEGLSQRVAIGNSCLMLLRFNSGNLPALRIQISGHGFVNITAESAFWTNSLRTRAFYVRRSLKPFGTLWKVQVYKIYCMHVY